MLRPLPALLVLAAAPAGLQPGQWQVVATPGTATLDGRALGDLPYSGPAGPGAVCLTAAEAADPAAWFARDIAEGCTLTRRAVANGRVDIAGACPSQAPGLAGGTVRLTGRWTPTGYDLRFATSNPSENGTMGFTGRMTGKRVGACAG